MTAMMGHELTTNAAKYGAFSTASGRVMISWTLAAEKLNLEWREEVDGGARAGSTDKVAQDVLGYTRDVIVVAVV
jgi:two-component sensor histidine kinase